MQSARRKVRHASIAESLAIMLAVSVAAATAMRASPLHAVCKPVLPGVAILGASPQMPDEIANAIADMKNHD